MDHHYRPESPDLSSVGARPVSPDLSSSGLQAPPRVAEFHPQAPPHLPAAFGAGHLNLAGSPYQPQPTSVPQYSPYDQQSQQSQRSQPYQQHQQHQQYPPYQQATGMPPPQHLKAEDEDEYMPDAQAPSRRQRRVKQEPNGAPSLDASPFPIKSETGDPTLGCTLNTSFPVARIKRIMQADEDIGKVAQVTPTIVSRALELFMIKLISASAVQARGPAAAGAGAAGKGPKRILAQHMKAAVKADEVLDFLSEIVDKVPDAPVKAKKETGSDSEEAKPKRRSKKRKDSGDDV